MRKILVKRVKQLFRSIQAYCNQNLKWLWSPQRKEWVNHLCDNMGANRRPLRWQNIRVPKVGQHSGGEHEGKQEPKAKFNILEYIDLCLAVTNPSKHYKIMKDHFAPFFNSVTLLDFSGMYRLLEECSRRNCANGILSLLS